MTTTAEAKPTATTTGEAKSTATTTEDEKGTWLFSNMLLQNGDSLLLQNGDNLLLEYASVLSNTTTKEAKL